jgi:hypothetical protein
MQQREWFSNQTQVFPEKASLRSLAQCFSAAPKLGKVVGLKEKQDDVTTIN